MKKIIKNIFCSIVIIYFIISIIYLVYNYNIVQNITDSTIPITNSTQMHDETISLEENVTISQLLKLNYYNGGMKILYDISNIVIISIIIGIILGSIISLKENHKAKWILYFIFGDFLYNTIFAIVIQGIYLKDKIRLNFFECFFESLKNNFITYILIFLVIMGIILLIKKVDVKVLNKELNKSKSK